MSLKRKFQTKAEIPAEQLPFYAEREGAWFLDADPSEELAKLAEFRDTNIGLKKQLEALQQRFQGIDPEEVRKLTEEKRKLEEAQQLKAGEVDKVVENRVKGLKSDWDKQVTTLSTERDALHRRLTAIQIDQGVITAATKRGLRPTAFPPVW